MVTFMAHPYDTLYPVLLYKSKVDDTPIQDWLASIPGKPYGKQNQPCKNEVYCHVSSKTTNDITQYSGYEDYVIDSPPTWLSDITGPNPHLCSHENIELLVKNSNWQPDKIGSN